MMSADEAGKLGGKMNRSAEKIEHPPIRFGNDPEIPESSVMSKSASLVLSSNPPSVDPAVKTVFFYGVLTMTPDSYQTAPIFSYAVAQGYQIMEREISTLESDLKNMHPVMVVINMDAMSFSDVLVGLSYLIPQYKHKTIFVLWTASRVTPVRKAFWRNFGVIDVISGEIEALYIFSMLKFAWNLFLAPNIDPEPVVDFDVNVDPVTVTAQRGSDVPFDVTVSPKIGGNFTVELSADAYTSNIAFVPRMTTVPFKAVMRVRILQTDPPGRKDVIVIGTAGKVMRITKAAIIVL